MKNELFIFIILFLKGCPLIIYFKCNLFYVDDYIDYIISSEGNIEPKNPSHTLLSQKSSEDYTFNFDLIKHNLDKPLCIELVNLIGISYFVFKYSSINEYDITNIKYEDFYYCNNCNMNTVKKFKTTNTFYPGSIAPMIQTSKMRYSSSRHTFCLEPTNDISKFYLDESKINQNFYKGKTIIYIFNNDSDIINLDNLFIINENETYIFDINTVSFKIINITNKKGNLYNEDEQLFENSFFNAKNNYLIHKRITDEGYLMIIKIVTKPRNQKNTNTTTCEVEAEINLYVSSKNCSMNESSDNFCQKCIPDYGKYEIDNRCLHKSEKINNYFYNNSNQIWSQCETEKNIFICSICPKGTFLKNNTSQICEKCPIGYISNEIDAIICEKCPYGFTSFIGSSECIPCEKTILHCNNCQDGKCLECNNEAINGYSNCTICENSFDWKYNGEKCELITKCQKYFYKDKYNKNKIICIDNIKECPDELGYLNLDEKECKEEPSPIDYVNYNFQIKGGIELLDKISDILLFDYQKYPEFYEEFFKKNKIKIEGIDSILQIGTEKNIKNQNGSYIGVDFGNCPVKLRTKIQIKNNDNNLIFKVFELTLNRTKIVNYHIYNTDDLETPLNLESCEGEIITIIQPPLEYFEMPSIVPEKLDRLMKIFNEDINIYNDYSLTYDDICYPLKLLDKYYITLEDRREYFDNFNLTFCEKGCQYEGGNIKTFQANCYCQIKLNMTNETSSSLFTKGFKDLNF